MATSRRVDLRLGLSLLLLPLLRPGPALAWGKTGHRVVAEIAEAHLSAAARLEVEALVGPESLAEIANWADLVRTDPAWRHTEPWHYVNVADGERYEDSTKNPEGDVLVAIPRLAATLADRGAPVAARAEALRFLVHFVADLHQPLHVGRGDDRGGNEVAITFFGKPTDLHEVWDVDLIDAQQLSFTEWVRFLDHPSGEDVGRWQASTVRDWADESQALRAEVYELGNGGVLGDEYLRRQLPTVERRLLQAGIRLAGLLEQALAPQRDMRDNR